MSIKRVSGIFDSISLDTVKSAAMRAFEHHGWKTEVIRFKEDFDSKCLVIYNALMDGSYMSLVRYKKLEKVNSNGKRRKIDSPTLVTRIYQHLFLELIEPVYYKKDNRLGLNCKPGCGITANRKGKSVIHKLKHLFYDRLDLDWIVVIDQRRCYEHITKAVFRRSLRRMVDDSALVDFATSICFVDGKLPIGTPTSPMVHHIVMLGFDYFAKEISSYSVRYADDVIMAFETKEEAQSAKWRVKNYWWYKLGIRAKHHTARVMRICDGIDFCGYEFHRNGRGINEHDKGYTLIRRSTAERAKRCRNNDGWASYFGLMSHADTFNLALKIENDMKLADLTSKIRIDREMDAKNIEIKDLIGKVITIYDYSMRKDGKGQNNWIKCLIGIEEVVDGHKTGRIEVREFHGNYQFIVQFIEICESQFGKSSLLPLEGVEIESQCGFIFKDSTNQIKYIA